MIRYVVVESESAIDRHVAMLWAVPLIGKNSYCMHMMPDDIYYNGIIFVAARLMR
jgi:hypothetical protein